MSSPSKRVYVLAAVAAAVLVAIAIVLVSRDSSSPQGESESGTTTTQATSASSSEEGATDTTASTVVGESTGQVDSGFVAPEPEALPLDVSVSDTSDLADGDTVSVHVTPRSGSNIYGLEAFLCKADTTFLLDADIRPTQTGKCVTKPLSAVSNDYVVVAVEPPYQAADLSFRVGVGTDSYTDQRGRAVSITCGPANPCQLVLKLQVPDSYGFQAYPLTFA